MGSRFAIVHKTEAASRGRTLVVGFSDAQITRSIVEISMLHEGCARAFATLGVSSYQRGQKFRANQTPSFFIVRSDQAFVVRVSAENFVSLIGDAADAFATSIIGRCHYGRWRGYDGRRFIFIFFVLGRA